MKKLNITIIITLLLISNIYLLIAVLKNKIDTTPLFDPFEINYNVSVDALKENGYERIPEDVPLLGKQIGDTLIYYQWDYEYVNQLSEDEEQIEQSKDYQGEKVYWRFCAIYLNSIDTTAIRNLVNKYDADLLSEFIINKHSIDSISYTAYIKHRYTNQIFRVYIGPTFSHTIEKKYELSFSNSFPMSKNEIDRMKWLFKD